MLIAQVSDIHAAPDNDHLARFDRVLRWLRQLQPDALVLSGDLTDNDWLEGYQQIAARLAEEHYPSLILPGNSDNRRLMRAVWREETGVKDTCDGALHAVLEVGGLRLMGLDTTVEGHDHGSVTAHLGWLEKQLNRADALPSILFLHHHVFPSGIPTLDQTLCRGLDRLEALIRRAATRPLAMASGHVHRPVAGMFAGIPAHICASVCPANPVWFGSDRVPPAEDAPGLMIHRYVNGALTSHHVRV